MLSCVHAVSGGVHVPPPKAMGPVALLCYSESTLYQALPNSLSELAICVLQPWLTAWPMDMVSTTILDPTCPDEQIDTLM